MTLWHKVKHVQWFLLLVSEPACDILEQDLRVQPGWRRLSIAAFWSQCGFIWFIRVWSSALEVDTSKCETVKCPLWVERQISQDVFRRLVTTPLEVLGACLSGRRPWELQSIYNHQLTLTPCMFLNCWWKLEFPDRTHADTGRTCRLHTERKRLDSNPGTYSCGTFSVKLAGWRPFHDWPQRVFIVLSCTLNGGEVWCCGACMKTATSGCFCLYMSEYITEINIKLHDFHLCVFLSRVRAVHSCLIK